MALIEGKDRLNRSLSECLCSHNQGLAVFLQGSRHDFSRTCRSLVHQDDNGVGGFVAVIAGPCPGLRVAFPSLRRDNDPRFHEIVGNLDRLIQKPAGIVPHVQKETPDRPLPCVHLAQGRPQLVDGVFLKGRQADVADLILVSPGLDGFDVDQVAGNGNVHDLVRVLAPDRQLHTGVLGPADFSHRFQRRHSPGRFAVDPHNLVPRLDAGVERGCVVNGRYDRDHPVLQCDFRADPAETPLQIRIEFPVHLCGHETGMRIKGVQQDRQGDLFVILIIPVKLFQVFFGNTGLHDPFELPDVGGLILPHDLEIHFLFRTGDPEDFRPALLHPDLSGEISGQVPQDIPVKRLIIDRFHIIGVDVFEDLADRFRSRNGRRSAAKQDRKQDEADSFHLFSTSRNFSIIEMQF